MTEELTHKQERFVEEYLKDFNGTQAAIRTGYSARSARVTACRLLTNTNILAAIRERCMSADEVLAKLTEQARADIGVFFKVVEEWTYFPLPSYDIIDAKEVIDDSDPDNPLKRISYWVRHVVVDTDKILDPQYSHLLHKFTDSPKNGIGIELYNKQAALQALAKVHGLMIDRTELTGKDGGEVTLKVVYENKAE